jgi:long-chain acyl-CoA synthetase
LACKPHSTRKEGESAIQRSLITPHGQPLLKNPEPDVRTLYDMFVKALERFPEKDCLGYRVGDGPFVWLKTREVDERATAVGSALVQHCKLTPKKENMVGIFAANSLEFSLFDLACAMYSLVSVPLYETFDNDALSYIVSVTEMRAIATAAKNLPRVFDILPKCKALKFIIVIDSTKIPAEFSERGSKAGVQLMPLKEFEAIGSSKKADHVPPSPEELATLCFTSGTTGVPKGAMLSHLNVTSNIASWCAIMKFHGILQSPQDRHLSYLPLAHMFERCVWYAMVYLGCQVGYYRGQIPLLFEDIAVLRPTVFPSVPRLLSRLHDKIVAGVDAQGGIKKKLFNYALEQKRKLLRQGVLRNDTFWDKLVFKKIQAKVGGQLKLIVTGAAPIDYKIIEFLRIVLGCQVIEGFGQVCCFGESFFFPSPATYMHTKYTTDRKRCGCMCHACWRL